MAIIEFADISKSYKKKEILSGFNLTVNENDFLVIIGPPGSGKSVILRLLLGLELPDSGKVFINGEDSVNLEPGERGIGYVPQSFALFPHLTVFSNIAYPLRLNAAPEEEIKKRVNKIAKMLNIEDLLEKKPDKLSGGQKQRVAIARGLVKESKIYVLDDPLVGLDFKLREQLQDDLKNLQKELNATFIYSTSDCLEALSLSDKIAVFSNKKCLELKNPEELYEHPQNIGSMRIIGFPAVNEIPGVVESDENGLKISFAGVEIKAETKGEGVNVGDRVIVCIRPEHLRLLDNSSEKLIKEKAELILKEDLGGEVIINIGWKGREMRSVADHDLSDKITTKEVEISMDPLDFHIYSEATGKIVARGCR